MKFSKSAIEDAHKVQKFLKRKYNRELSIDRVPGRLVTKWRCVSVDHGTPINVTAEGDGADFYNSLRDLFIKEIDAVLAAG